MHRLQTLSSQLAAPQPCRSSRRPITVCVTGAAGNIAYALLFQIGSGSMLGTSQPIRLRLLDIPPMAEKLKGVEMEIRDCAFPVFVEIVATTDYKTAFEGCDLALLVGARPRSQGMLRKDLLIANAAIFAGQGKAINQYANRNIKVVVVGNPANTNALITALHAPDISPRNFTALTRLDQNRAVSQLSSRSGVSVGDINNVIIWGNHSKTQYPDVRFATAVIDGNVLPLSSVVNDDRWVRDEFISTVQQRGAAIIKARKLSSAASAANAVVDHVRDWFLGTPDGQYVSMAVMSDGSYGIPQGIIYSFPVVCRNGRYEIVQGLQIDDFSRGRMQATAEELLSEKEQALSELN